MAFGDQRGVLAGNAASITNPFAATGSVAGVVARDLVYAVFAEQTSNTITAVNDNLGNNYTPTAVAGDAGVATGRAFYSIVTNAGTITSVSATATASTNNVAANAVVIEGPFSAIDANPSNSVNADVASPFVCPSTGTLAQPDEVVIAWGSANYGTVWTATAPNVLADDEPSAAVIKVALGRQTVAATTAVAPVFAAAGNPTQTVLGTTSFMKAGHPTMRRWGGVPWMVPGRGSGRSWFSGLTLSVRRPMWVLSRAILKAA